MKEKTKLPIDESVGLLLTHRCNLNCVYCYISNKRNVDMSITCAKEILSPLLAKRCGTLLITLMGGEPLIVFNTIVELVNWLENGSWNRSFSIFGSTNGTLLDSNKKSWLKKHSSTISLGLSYDGLYDTQIENRGTANIDLDFFLQTWPSQPVQMTITANSVANMSKGVISLLEKGFKVHPNIAYEKTEWTNEQIVEYGKQLNELIYYYFQHPEKPLIRQFIHNINEYAHNIITPPTSYATCGVDNGFCVYDSKKVKYPCHILSPLVADLNQLRNISKFNNCYFDNCVSNECKSCPFVSSCSTCIACNYLYRGALSNRDLTHCEIMKLEVKAFIKLKCLQLLHKRQISSSDATICDSIIKINKYLQ